MAAENNSVELGFVDDAEPVYLESHYFPSKVGGKPAWLALDKLPKTEELLCKVCGNPSAFLLQIYSPVEEQDRAFHRTLFIFTCKNPDCCKKNDAANFHVFRSQLPKKNKYFSDEPPSEKYDPSEKPPSAAQYGGLCALCGCPGTKTCAKCQSVSYCSKAHQVLDWKHGHKKACSSAGRRAPAHCFHTWG